MTEEKDKKETGYGEVVKCLVKDKDETRIIEALLNDEELPEIIEELIHYKKGGK